MFTVWPRETPSSNIAAKKASICLPGFCVVAVRDELWPFLVKRKAPDIFSNPRKGPGFASLNVWRVSSQKRNAVGFIAPLRCSFMLFLIRLLI